MLLTGIILGSTVSGDAFSDLRDLRAIIDSAANTIGAPTNSSRNWGILSPNTAPAQLGTADLVSNITSTILRAKYQLDTNQIGWVNATNAVNTTSPPSVTPPSNTNGTVVTTTLNGTSFDSPYIDYVNAIPNLATALTALGRTWHREMNLPVREAIDALQRTVSTFSTSMLEANLINAPAVIRTIRASSSLESAQQAWGRLLNLPGSPPAAKRSFVDKGGRRPVQAKGMHYKHKGLRARLWGSRQVRDDTASAYGGGVVVVGAEEKRSGSAARVFVA
ncbi:hypothetical protein BDV95DRAFT_589090 [Massariosphaeria phaeospora]|uniref:Uncharacterized protein n=1 Tax=Massariosphaeria phaeospora TaxID=100035 RepID=A0A7C8MK04_9PLEO|nr:hypothetical protein BDV95DRAFT_589090 [Massariosphaeria phaeospora]